MTATGPPGKVRAPGLASGGAEDGAAANGSSVSTVLDRPVAPDPVVAFLEPVVRHGLAVGDVPLLDSPEWAALPPLDLRKAAAVARAALAWHADGRPDTIRERMTQDLADIDLYTKWRVREAGLDVHGRGDTDWSRIHEVVTNRAAYRARWGVPA
jgi:hypothetical protein